MVNVESVEKGGVEIICYPLISTLGASAGELWGNDERAV